jgi:putative tricarboxylic transport membrane protein
MESVLGNIILGFGIACTIENLLFCFLGVFIGTLIGVLPGLGPTGAISLLLPVTFGINPASAVIMLAGIYYGAQYGGSTTSILVNIPGEASSVVTCLDGYRMARQGRAGAALGIAAFGSFIAGTASLVFLMFLAIPMTKVALSFGPPEYFSLMILAMSLLIYLGQGSMIKAAVMAAFGLCLSQIGTDIITGQTRFTFGIDNLQDGIDLIPLVMGLFGIGEVLSSLEQQGDFEIFKGKIKGLLPTLNDWKDSAGAIVRGTFLGFFLGVLPGGGAIISSFISYTLEKKISKHPETFGAGAIAGVAGPESANNAATSGAFIPLLTLGIPSNAVMALLLGALMIHGVQPGPLLFKQHPDVFWGIIASMYIGNIFLLILNLPLIGLWVKMLKIPYRILFPFILFFCIIGAYSVNNRVSDVFVMFLFGIVGFLFKKFNYEAAPLLMAFILGPMLENSLRQSLLLSMLSPMIFFTRSISASFLIATCLLLIFSILFRRRRRI